MCVVRAARRSSIAERLLLRCTMTKNGWVRTDSGAPLSNCFGRVWPRGFAHSKSYAMHGFVVAVERVADREELERV